MTGSSRSLRRRSALLLVLAIVVATAVGLGRAWWTRRIATTEATRASTAVVAVTKPQQPDTVGRLELPATLSAFIEAPIYARTSGYLARLHADIGQRVRRGELLAEIDTPEIDQQLAQAKAQLDEASASRDLARLSAERYHELRGRGLVSQQDEDEKKGALNQLEASVRAARANLDRLRDLQGFKRVVAPFDGVITRRDVDPGTLIDAGGTAANRELFAVAQTDPVKVYVNIPQSDALAVRPGLPAWVELTEYPGRRFSGTVTRTAGAIDAKARTLLTQIELPNKDGALLPGAYARVFIEAPVAGRGLLVPVPSLLFRADGPRLAIVKPDNRIELRAITIGRNTGTNLEVLTGIGPDDRVVLNPGDSIEEGQRVEVRASPGPAPGSGAPGR